MAKKHHVLNRFGHRVVEAGFLQQCDGAIEFALHRTTRDREMHHAEPQFLLSRNGESLSGHYQGGPELRYGLLGPSQQCPPAYGR